MIDEERRDWEQRLHGLLCGGGDERTRRQTLRALEEDERPREVLREMLREQDLVREAVLGPASEAAMQAGLAATLERVRERQPARPRTSGAEPRWRWRRSMGAWALPLAAALVLAVAAAYLASASRELRTELAQFRSAQAVPETAGREDLSRYRTIWQQVDAGDNSWVLIHDGEGQFGSLNGSASAVPHGRVLLVRCRIVDEQGEAVYSADLLVPDRPELRVRLPRTGTIAGRPAHLAIATSGGQAAVGLRIGAESEDAASEFGVVGRTAIDGEGAEIGRFRLDERTLRVLVRTQRLRGFES